ncbi:hypothetical protein F441_15133 [Phytophthora nicotianae CJ01A1]|uniref:Uncharacterized protein n=3 Tax=Phytophthora nicotianae TaxID=4792 RepID=W2R2Q0_PHYN3|nr:hypothetical protein PPTG_21381 [Phytophthora nicotianae INRA-310]ETK79257.1 hypothetical protein L915_14865 [Phytophthora nicotianae]ETN18979.1 hypothetical protein PPTG_21381 [Phytophthora nicotianae INRA-310]ETP08957.1 hypothetical protein F441_15133 [Phytophthora nicotianae CJ01A1]
MQLLQVVAGSRIPNEYYQYRVNDFQSVFKKLQRTLLTPPTHFVFSPQWLLDTDIYAIAQAER